MTDTPKFDIQEYILRGKKHQLFRTKKQIFRQKIKEQKTLQYSGDVKFEVQSKDDLRTIGSIKYLFGNLQEVRWKDSLQKYLRNSSLSSTDINPLLVVRSVREIDGVKECYDKIDFIDVLWVKNYSMEEALKKTREFVKEHPEYTHIILSSDDIFPTPEIVIQLLNDILIWDFPTISGCCNYCPVWLPENNMVCPLCKSGAQHLSVNVSKESLDYKDKIVTVRDYIFISDDYRIGTQHIEKVWFQGHALSCIRRDIFERYGCMPYTQHNGTVSYSDDFSFAVLCSENNIEQFVDYRVFMKHDSLHHKNLTIGKDQKLTLIKPKIFLGSVLISEELVPILICSPFNNESHSIDKYINSLLSINYPKHLIDLVWLENDSVDGTWEMLQKYYKEIKHKYNYHSFQLIQKKYNLERFGKISVKDFGKPELDVFSGKNYVRNNEEKIARASRLIDIYHFFFSQMVEGYHKYWMMLMVDVVVPQNIIERYLEVFRKHSDAGWVGGVHHKRFPTHIRQSPTILPHMAGLAAPLMFSNNFTVMRYMTDEEILVKQKNGEIVFECGVTGHAWMVDAESIFDGARMEISPYEIVVPFIRKLHEMGKKVYCVSDIYLKHISLDGKIYRENLYEEVARFSINDFYTKKLHLYKEAQEKDYIEKKKANVDNLNKRVSELNKDTKNDFLQSYLTYVSQALKRGFTIPTRPPEGCTVFDKTKNRDINIKEWDTFYGRWKEFIELKIEKRKELYDKKSI